jgi:hypothetical protein
MSTTFFLPYGDREVLVYEDAPPPKLHAGEELVQEMRMTEVPGFFIKVGEGCDTVTEALKAFIQNLGC